MRWSEALTKEASVLVKRILIIYHCTERYFGPFEDIVTNTASLNNPKVAAHKKDMLRPIGKAVRDMDGMKEACAALSRLYEKLNMNPDNFKLLADSITSACNLKKALTPQVQAIWQKFLSAVVEAMNSQYK